MRTAYHQQLTSLTAQLAQACGQASAAMQRATQALLAADLALASQVVGDHERISVNSAQARRDAFVLLALQAPVAGDLRAVIGSIQNAADIERMGALALHVAKIAARRYPQHALPAGVREAFAEMGRIAADLGCATQQALLSGDPAAATLIPLADDEMDRLHRRMFGVVLDGEWQHDTAATVDVTLLSEFYERFADHAVEVARRVVFQATGRFPDEQLDFDTHEVDRAAKTVDAQPGALVAAGARGNTEGVA